MSKKNRKLPKRIIETLSSKFGACNLSFCVRFQWKFPWKCGKLCIYFRICTFDLSFSWAKFWPKFCMGRSLENYLLSWAQQVLKQLQGKDITYTVDFDWFIVNGITLCIVLHTYILLTWAQSTVLALFFTELGRRISLIPEAMDGLVASPLILTLVLNPWGLSTWSQFLGETRLRFALLG